MHASNQFEGSAGLPSVSDKPDRTCGFRFCYTGVVGDRPRSLTSNQTRKRPAPSNISSTDAGLRVWLADVRQGCGKNVESVLFQLGGPVGVFDGLRECSDRLHDSGG